MAARITTAVLAVGRTEAVSAADHMAEGRMVGASAADRMAAEVAHEAAEAALESIDIA